MNIFLITTPGSLNWILMAHLIYVENWSPTHSSNPAKEGSPYCSSHALILHPALLPLCGVWLRASELTAETLGLGDISPRTGSNFSWHSIGLKWMEQPECATHILRARQKRKKTWDFWLQIFFPSLWFSSLTLEQKPSKHVSKHLQRKQIIMHRINPWMQSSKTTQLKWSEERKLLM